MEKPNLDLIVAFAVLVTFAIFGAIYASSKLDDDTGNNPHLPPVTVMQKTKQ